MIITLEQALCNKLDFVDFEDKTILSFELDKQKIKQVLKTGVKTEKIVFFIR